MKRVTAIKKHDLARRFIAKALRDRGHDVREFDHPASFLESVDEHADCIVTGVWFDRDLSPSGISLIRELSRQGVRVPVIVFSSLKEHEQEAAEAAAYAFLCHNTFDFTELADLVSEAIASQPSMS
jgi:DNA-binding NtrC family response regulator